MNGFFDIRGEEQTIGGNVFLEDALQPIFIYRADALVKLLDFYFINVVANHLIAKLGQTSARDQSNIARSNDCYLHHQSPIVDD